MPLGQLEQAALHTNRALPLLLGKHFSLITRVNSINAQHILAVRVPRGKLQQVELRTTITLPFCHRQILSSFHSLQIYKILFEIIRVMRSDSTSELHWKDASLWKVKKRSVSMLFIFHDMHVRTHIVHISSIWLCLRNTQSSLNITFKQFSQKRLP